MLFLALMSFQTLQAQDLQEQKSEFNKLINDSKGTWPKKEGFNLSTEMPFLKDSEFFKASEDKLVLPFRAEMIKTIPQLINTGGDRFNHFIEASIGEKSAFEFLINAAAEVFGVDKDKIELRFLWFLADKDETEIKVWSNSVVINQHDKGFSAQMKEITESEMVISPEFSSSGVNKYFKKFSWDEKVRELSPKD